MLTWIGTTLLWLLGNLSDALGKCGALPSTVKICPGTLLPVPIFLRISASPAVIVPNAARPPGRGEVDQPILQRRGEMDDISPAGDRGTIRRRVRIRMARRRRLLRVTAGWREQGCRHREHERYGHSASVHH